MLLGDRFSEQFLLDERVYFGFIDVFGDKNPLHVNSEFARRNGFYDSVMHGNILGGFLSYFIGECLPVKNVIIHTQEIKYLRPIYLNDVLRLHAEIVNHSEAVRIYELKFHFENENLEKVARGNVRIGLLTG